VKCARDWPLGEGNTRPKYALKEIIFTGDESTVLDDTTVLSDNVVDGGKEPKAARGCVTPLGQGG